MLKKENKITPLESTQPRLRKSMIKSCAVQQSPLSKVTIKANPVEKYEFLPHDSTVEPIMDNGLVVGVYHRCRCGESTEIRFELEKSTSSKILES